MALSAPRDTPEYAPLSVKRAYPVKANAVIYPGAIVMLNGGYAVQATLATSLQPAGAYQGTSLVDATGLQNGDLTIEVTQGIFRWDNHGSMTQAAVGGLCYAFDDHSVQTSATSASIAGVVAAVDSLGVWVECQLTQPVDAAALTTFISNLASTSHSEGASLVGVEDAGTLLTAATVEDALTEIVKKANAALGNPVTIPVILAAHTNGSIAARFTPGVAGKILGIHASVVNPATTGSKLATFTPAIAGTPTTGGALALTSANCTPVGAKVDGSTITAANTFSAAQEITIAASSVTAFVEGEVVIYLFLASA